MTDASSSQLGSSEDGAISEADSMSQSSPFDAMCEALQRTVVPTVRIVAGDGVDSPPDEFPRRVTALTFVREYVMKSMPCKVLGLIDEWPALKLWTDDTYFFRTGIQSPAAPPPTVTVALTPNGRADCVTDVTYLVDDTSPDVEEGNSDRFFMLPAEVKITLPDLLSLLKHSKEHAFLCHPLSVDLTTASPSATAPPPRWRKCGQRDTTIPIPYCQMQNNCFETEFSFLQSDVTCSLRAFGEHVFGVPCEATNLWLGTSNSVTSLHQDWYENLYAIVRGQKQFLLVPPWEGGYLRKERLKSARYRCNETVNADALHILPTIEIAKEDEYIEWIGVDPEDTAEHEILDRNPEIMATHPLHVTVDAGEVLYLPAMWFHRVAQLEVPSDDTCTIAVNYWYDMQMDGPLYHLVRHVTESQLRRGARRASAELAGC